MSYEFALHPEGHAPSGTGLNFSRIDSRQHVNIQTRITITRQGDIQTSFVQMLEDTPNNRAMVRYLNECTKPLPIDKINNLHCVHYKTIENPTNTECCISLEPFEPDDMVYMSNCNHIFKECAIKVWLKTKNSCPLCRKPILADNTNEWFEQRRHGHTVTSISHYELNELDIQLVMSHTSGSREQTIQALQQNNGDILDSIMEIGSGIYGV